MSEVFQNNGSSCSGKKNPAESGPVTQDAHHGTIKQSQAASGGSYS
jgi:hypothetical protein